MNKKISLCIIAMLFALVFYKLVVYGSYFLPTTISIGNCHPDWTSRETYPSIYGDRKSPLETLKFKIEEADVQVCYGAPLVKGRQIFGKGDSTLVRLKRRRYDLHGKKDSELVTYGSKWRMGANEPTRVFINKPITLGTISLEPGRYSIHATIRKDQWDITLNESIFHWGADFSKRVLDQNIGSFIVPVNVDSTHFAEKLNYSFENRSGEGFLSMKWGHYVVLLPISQTN